MAKRRKITKFSKVTRNDMADVFDVDVRTISRWFDMGLPRRRDGLYDLPLCIQWRLDAVLATTKSPEKESPALEKQRQIKNKLLEFELGIKREQYVPYTQIIRCWGGRIKLVRDALLFLVDRLPPLLVNLSQNEIQERLRDEVHNILNQFSREGKFTPTSKVKDSDE